MTEVPLSWRLDFIKDIAYGGDKVMVYVIDCHGVRSIVVNGG